MKKNNVLVFAAHPDDEILGCGATMAKLTAEGYNVVTVIAAQGITSRDTTKSQQKALKTLKESCFKANQILGVKKIHFLDLPDNRMDSLDLLDVVKKVEELINLYKPTVILTHHAADLNIDHQILNRAVLTASRPQPDQQRSIFFFEVLSATHWFSSGAPATAFIPNTFIDVSTYLNKKLLALKSYQDEMRPFPHARSMETVKHLAHLRGSEVGLEAAEAFMVGRTFGLNL